MGQPSTDNQRDWYEQPDGSWVERYVNGASSNFSLIAQNVSLQIVSVGNQRATVPGRVIEKSDQSMIAFIPDQINAGMWLQFKVPGSFDGQWSYLAMIRSVDGTIASVHGPAPTSTTAAAAQSSADLSKLDLATLTQQANAGDAAAEAELGNRYEEARGGVARDYSQAILWYQKAAAQGNAVAEDGLGSMYMNGWGTAKDNAQGMVWYQKAAAQGDATAEFDLGAIYQRGLGVPVDLTQARAWFQLAAAHGLRGAQMALARMDAPAPTTAAAAQSSADLSKLDLATLTQQANAGNAAAANQIGEMFWNGSGVPKDYAQSFAWYSKAAQQGNANSEYWVGVQLQNAYGVQRDYAQAMAWYQKAAAQGHMLAENNIGSMYDYGQGIARDYAQAVAWYQKAAAQGSAVAENNIGSMYYNGEGVPKDYAQAMFWYQKAANQGQPSAEVSLGIMYRDGTATAKDPAQAVSWFNKAAAQGNAFAEANLGAMYMFAQGIPQDYAQAETWLQKAAAQGNAASQNNLGYLYQNGLGIARDATQAIFWYQKAAQQGLAAAEDDLGEMYYMGTGTTRDYGLAFSLFNKAATQGLAVGENDLGNCYATGNGTQEDLTQARFWLQKAAAQGFQAAKNELAKLDAPDTTQDAQTQTTQPTSDSAQPSADDIADQIASLQSDIEMHQQAVQMWNDSAAKAMDNSSCGAGLAAALCGAIGDAGAAKARANANAESNAIADDQAKIAQLQGETPAPTQHLDTTFAGNIPAGTVPTPTQNQTNAPGRQGGTASTNGNTACHVMNSCVQVVSSQFDKDAGQANGVLHVVVRNNCSTRIRITTTFYAPNASCTQSQTNNFNPGDSEDMGGSTGQNWYQIRADDNVTSGMLGTGCTYAVAVPTDCR